MIKNLIKQLKRNPEKLKLKTHNWETMKQNLWIK